MLNFLYIPIQINILRDDICQPGLLLPFLPSPCVSPRNVTVSTTTHKQGRRKRARSVHNVSSRCDPAAAVSLKGNTGLSDDDTSGEGGGHGRSNDRDINSGSDSDSDSDSSCDDGSGEEKDELDMAIAALASGRGLQDEDEEEESCDGDHDRGGETEKEQEEPQPEKGWATGDGGPGEGRNIGAWMMSHRCDGARNVYFVRRVLLDFAYALW